VTELTAELNHHHFLARIYSHADDIFATKAPSAVNGGKLQKYHVQ
jgi:hypothetical protein